jgi:hypothetical protein
MKFREATEAERASITPPTDLECWCFVAEEEGRIEGHICLTRAMGEVFGHDTGYTGTDPHVPVRLWFKAREKAKEWGASSVNVHVTEETDPTIVGFWDRLGFVPVMTIYRGDI